MSLGCPSDALAEFHEPAQRLVGHARAKDEDIEILAASVASDTRHAHEALLLARPWRVCRLRHVLRRNFGDRVEAMEVCRCIA